MNSLASRIDEKTKVCAHWCLWLATQDPAHLEEAGRLVAATVERAPPEYRTSILEGVRIHREVAQAARIWRPGRDSNPRPQD